MRRIDASLLPFATNQTAPSTPIVRARWTSSRPILSGDRGARSKSGWSASEMRPRSAANAAGSTAPASPRRSDGEADRSATGNLSAWAATHCKLPDVIEGFACHLCRSTTTVGKFELMPATLGPGYRCGCAQPAPEPARTLPASCTRSTTRRAASSACSGETWGLSSLMRSARRCSSGRVSREQPRARWRAARVTRRRARRGARRRSLAGAQSG